MTEVKQRAVRYAALQNLLTTVQAYDDTITVGEIQSSMCHADNSWEKLEEAHNAIIDITDEKDLSAQFTAYKPMSSTYYKIKAVLFNLQNKISTKKSSPKKLNLRLPDMSLPKFDGKYEDWPTFQDLFCASIHNNSDLSGSQKLQYLKSCLTGQAESIIKSFTITDVNYSEAWSLLEQQFDNKREIVMSHVKRLLFQPSIKQESAAALQEMLTLTLECLRSLKGLSLPVDQWDAIVCVLLTENFDKETKAEWARSLRGTDPPTFKEVQDFIQQHIRTLHAKGSIQQSMSNVSVANSGTTHKRLNTYHTSFQSSCKHCEGAHQLYQCTLLKEMTPDKRCAVVKSLNLCLNCFREGHFYKECRSESRCRKCNKLHNTFLHFDQNSLQQSSTDQQSSSSHQQLSSDDSSTVQQNSSGPQHSSQNQSVVQQSRSNSNRHINVMTNSVISSDSPRLLKTALVDVFDASNVKGQVRVFIDEGAEGSLITERTMNRLGLQKTRTDFLVSGVCGALASKSRWRTEIRLYSKINNQHIDVELFAVPKITNDINRLNYHKPNHWKHIEGLQLADPFYYEGGNIDILIGADTAPYILKPSIKRADRNAPVAQDTIFGWVLCGNVSIAQEHTSSITISHFKLNSTDTICKLNSTDTLCKLQSSNKLSLVANLQSMQITNDEKQETLRTEKVVSGSYVKWCNKVQAALQSACALVLFLVIQYMTHFIGFLQCTKTRSKVSETNAQRYHISHLIMMPHNHPSTKLKFYDLRPFDHHNSFTPPTHSPLQQQSLLSCKCVSVNMCYCVVGQETQRFNIVLNLSKKRLSCNIFALF